MIIIKSIFKHSTKLRKVPNPFLLKLWKKAPSIRLRIKYFIAANKLYLADDIKTSQNADKQRHTKIADSLTIKYKVTIDEYQDYILHLELQRSGAGTIDNRLLDFETTLSSLFSAPCIRVQNTISSVTYLFRLKESKNEFIHVLSNDKTQFKKNEIKLSKYDNWDLNLPHLSLSGQSGSGKSRMLYYIINQIMHETESENIFICDPKSDELSVYSKQIFKLSNVYTTKQDILHTMKKIEKLMEERYKERNLHDITQTGTMLKFEHTFLIFDELSAFQAILEKKNKENINEKELFHRILKSLAVKARACNIHLILVAQQLSSENLPTEIREQMTIKIALGSLSPENYKMNFSESKETKQLFDKTEKGSGYIKIEGNTVKDFQAPKILTQWEA